VGARLGEANTLQAIGKLQEDWPAGLDYLQQAQVIYQQIGDQYSQSLNLLFMADCHVQLQQTDAAIEALQQAAELASRIGYEPFQQDALNKIAELQQPTPASRTRFPGLFFRLRRWHYVLLGLSVFLLVLLIRWIAHK
jgi:tetratricopeptide (TPR) repeat protein